MALQLMLHDPDPEAAFNPDPDPHHCFFGDPGSATQMMDKPAN